MPDWTLNLQQRIREAAYKKWEAEGHQHGRALDHWLESEKDLRGKTAMTINDVVLFVGAGFSKSVAEIPIDLLKSIITYFEAEQDADTTDKIKFLLSDHIDATTAQFELLLSIVQRLQHQNSAGRRVLQNIQNPDDLWSRLVAAVAEVTYFKHEGRADWGERLKPLTEFFKKVSVSVISTNYDLIVDKAALEAAGRRCLKDLRRYQYGYPIRELFPKKDQSVPWSCDEGVTQIYKLHGSMNWAYCEYCNALDLAAEKDDLKALQKPTDRPRCYVCGASYKPMLIPPVPNKGVMSNPVLAQVWRKAEEVLETARLVIFVGYSLPSADPLVAEMLATARLRSNQARDGPWRFCVIDPSCFTHARYRNVLGSGGRHYVADFNFELLWDSWRSCGVPFGQCS